MPGEHCLTLTATAALLACLMWCFAAKIEDMRREIGVSSGSNGVDELQLIELIDEGTYGKVFRGKWCRATRGKARPKTSAAAVASSMRGVQQLSEVRFPVFGLQALLLCGSYSLPCSCDCGNANEGVVRHGQL